MKNEYLKAMCMIGAIIAFLGIYTILYNKICYVETPDVRFMDLPDAISVIEDAGIIEDDDHIYEINIVDSKTNANLEIGDFMEYEKYTVVEQIPQAGERLKIHSGIFYKFYATQITDVLTVYVDKRAL